MDFGTYFHGVLYLDPLHHGPCSVSWQDLPHLLRLVLNQWPHIHLYARKLRSKRKGTVGGSVQVLPYRLTGRGLCQES